MRDNREYTRYDKEMRIEYTIAESSTDTGCKGRIYNISLGGIYMVTEHLIKQDSKLNLYFSFLKNNELIILQTTGTVLRSGSVISDYEVNKKYNLIPEDGGYFTVVRFFEPFIELSFMLH